jgi:predicted acetyltransferase
MYSLKVSNHNKINSYLELFKQNFPGHFFSIHYLEWLYKKNPDGKLIGVDIFFNKEIVGHVGGIPINFTYNKKKIKSLIAINFCLNKQYRKSGLIYKAQKKLFKILKDKKFVLFITIANTSAVKSWLKVKLEVLKPLEVKFFYPKLDSFNDLDIFKKKLHPQWTKKKLQWRTQSPRTNFKVIKFNNFICLENKIKFLSALSPIKLDEDYKFAKSLKNILPKIFIGLGFKKIFNTFSIDIPLFLRPSPLIFMYKIFNKSNFKKQYLKEMQFSLVDMDVY